VGESGILVHRIGAGVVISSVLIEGNALVRAQHQDGGADPAASLPCAQVTGNSTTW